MGALTYPSGMRRSIGLFLLLVLAACTDASDGATAEAPDEVTGVITDIESPSFGEVEHFTLREEGETFTIYIADDVEYEFPLSHLQEHLGTDPVTCKLEERDGKLYALTIDDV